MNPFVIPTCVPILFGMSVFCFVMFMWAKRNTTLIDLFYKENPNKSLRGLVYEITSTSWGKILIGPQDMQKELEAAGYTTPDAEERFDLIRGILLIAGAIAAFIGLITTQILWLTALLAIKLPEWVVIYKAKKRKKDMRKDFIGFTARLAATLAAGLEMERALEWANRRTGTNTLTTEMKTILNKVKTGISLEQSLFDFAEKTDLLEARRVATAIVQSQKHGLSVSESLMTAVRDMRDRRQQGVIGRAKTAEQKLGLAVLMMSLPTIICTLAALLMSMAGQTGGLGL